MAQGQDSLDGRRGRMEGKWKAEVVGIKYQRKW